MLLLLYLLVLNFNLVACHYYKAHTGMKTLFEIEQNLANSFITYYRREKERLDELEKLIERLQPEKNETLKEHENKIVHNPVDAYKLIKRFTKQWKPGLDRFERKKFVSSALLRYQNLIEKTEGFHNNVELRGSIYSIIKLQETYLINVSEFANGLNEQSQKLTEFDIFTIGYFAMGMQYFHTALLWLDEAFKRYLATPDENMFAPFNVTILLHAAAWSSFKCGNIEKATYYAEKQFELDPYDEELRRNLAYYRSQENKFTEDSIYSKYGISSDEMDLARIGEFTNRPWLTRLNRMCRGEEKMRQKDKDRLYCSYYSPTYRFYLKPLQLELAYDDPNILFFHNLLSDAEVDKLISQSRLKLATAEVFSKKTGKLITADYRVSKNAWFSPWDDLMVYNIYRRVGDLMDLNLAYCEPLQVANYGIGGNYESHYDHATAPHNSSIFGGYDWGNRIATMLFYLSDVEKGGDTVFVETAPGIVVSPKRGAGVFWYNLKRNGGSDDKTKHAGCPVLSGEKWIANLWIHEHGQEFHRPCSLDPSL